MKSLSRVLLFTTPWTAAYQAPLSMGFSRQEYWSGVPMPSPVGGYLLQLFAPTKSRQTNPKFLDQRQEGCHQQTSPCKDLRILTSISKCAVFIA